MDEVANGDGNPKLEAAHLRHFGYGQLCLGL
jgi:hypothetical protein